MGMFFSDRLIFSPGMLEKCLRLIVKDYHQTNMWFESRSVVNGVLSARRRGSHVSFYEAAARVEE